jgi:hypothetical protein
MMSHSIFSLESKNSSSVSCSKLAFISVKASGCPVPLNVVYDVH